MPLKTTKKLGITEEEMTITIGGLERKIAFKSQEYKLLSISCFAALRCTTKKLYTTTLHRKVKTAVKRSMVTINVDPI